MDSEVEHFKYPPPTPDGRPPPRPPKSRSLRRSIRHSTRLEPPSTPVAPSSEKEIELRVEEKAEMECDAPPVMEPLNQANEAARLEAQQRSLESLERRTRLQQARKVGRQLFKFVWMFFVCLMAVTAIISGARYKDDCPAEPMIPVYLAVNGFAIILYYLCYLMSELKSKKSSCIRCIGIMFTLIVALLGIFLIAWHILGSVYVYRNWKPRYEPNRWDDWCDKRVYVFAFISVTLPYALMAIGLIKYILEMCCELCCYRGQGEKPAAKDWRLLKQSIRRSSMKKEEQFKRGDKTRTSMVL